jgi:hypothetical protein
VRASNKVRNQAAELYRFELEAHYTLLKKLDHVDPVRAVLQNCSGQPGDTEYAKRFWHGVFRNFPELRSIFPAHAERFGPYA